MNPVLVTLSGDVATITLNRPQRLNAITVELGLELERAVRESAEVAKVIVIRGSEGNFCVGGDFWELSTLREQGSDAMVPMFENFGRACQAVAEVPVPVICAVEGFAMAGGFELLLAADIVLLHENAVIADIHSKYGQIPGGGSTQRLPRLVGRQRALGLIFSADRLSAYDALDWGLGYRVYPADEFEDAVASFAESLAEKNSRALATTKALVNEGLQLPLSEGLDLERRSVVAHIAAVGVGDGRV